MQALFFGVFAGSDCCAQKEESVAAAENQQVVEEQSGEPVLRFSFDRMPWRDVIDWLATSSDLALHVGELPTGSFTYNDASDYTPQEALDRINLFLLPEGFTLVRSRQLLSVIDLSDPRSLKQLDSLARLVTKEQLASLEDHEVVKCLFPLGELKAEDAVEELSALQLISAPAVFSKTNQLMITDTVGKLKSAASILDAFEPRTMTNGTVVKSFALKHVEAEDVLVVARPHLGLATDEMIGIDVSISADLQGKNLFVTGVEDKVKLIEGLVSAIDIPMESDSLTDSNAELRAHVVESGNLETVYNVLQTLLAGKNVRLSTDAEAGTIVALAGPDVQSEIAATVTQLQAAEAEFAVIPLKSVDPYFAITLIEQMLDLPDPLDVPAKGEIPKGPRIDADPGNMRLFVRGKKHEVEQIRKIVVGLDVGADSVSDGVRLFAVSADRAEQVLETASRFWRSANPIIYYPAADLAPTRPTERTLNDERVSADTFFSEAGRTKEASSTRLMTSGPLTDQPAIRCQLVPRGLLLQSEDVAALDRFEEHLRTITGPADSAPSPPVVFYLKYTRPADAVRMLAELLDGGDAAREGEAGTLINGYVSGGSGSFLSSIVSTNEGTVTMMSDSITVVADSRLNRLIAQGTTSDIEKIESYLKIIEKDTSITDIETYGKSHIIELTYTRASEVAAAIRESYADRVAGGSNGTAGGANGKTMTPEQQAAAAKAAAAEAAAAAKAKTATKGTSSGGGSKSEKNLEPKMTIAVHERSNSLIVTAPEQLFKEVEQLALSIDERSRQSVEIIKVPDGVPFDVLLEMFSGGTSISQGSSSAARAPLPVSKSKSR